MCSIPSGSLYDGPWTQFDCLSCCEHLAIYWSFKFSLQLFYSCILCILFSFKLGDNFVDLRYNCGHLLIIQILAPSSFVDTLCLYVGALRYICWPWLFWGMLLFMDRSDNRVSYFINFFFVDLECCGSLLIVQIFASYIVSTSFTYTLLDHVARFVNRVCRGSFWTFRLSIQLLYSLLLCILSTLKLGGRFVGLGCCGSLLICKLFEFDRSDSRSSYFINSFYVFSVRWGL